MDWIALKTELTTDPLGRGYTAMTNDQAAGSLNTKNRTRNRTVINAWEIIDCIVPSEWSPLTADQKNQLLLITGAGQVDIQNTNNRTAFLAMFGAGTQTRTNVIAIQTETISRAVELGLGQVDAGDVAYARSL